MEATGCALLLRIIEGDPKKATGPRAACRRRDRCPLKLAASARRIGKAALGKITPPAPGKEVATQDRFPLNSCYPAIVPDTCSRDRDQLCRTGKRHGDHTTPDARRRGREHTRGRGRA